VTPTSTWLHDKGDKVEPLGDNYTEPARLGGLTAFGASVVKECNRLGIVVDLAHASHETVLGALKVASQPMIVSHTSLDTRPGKNPGWREWARAPAKARRRMPICHEPCSFLNPERRGPVNGTLSIQDLS
jgi:hypothetical protein